MLQISSYYEALIENDPHAMALFPTNDEVNEFNELVIKHLQLQLYVIEAEDSEIRINKSKKDYKRPCMFDFKFKNKLKMGINFRLNFLQKTLKCKLYF